MGERWARIEGWANRIGIWFTAFLAMTAVFGWVASNLVAFKPYGWPEAVIAGFLLACFAILALAAGLAAWRFFNPLGSPTSGEQSAGRAMQFSNNNNLANELRGEMSARDDTLRTLVTGVSSDLRAVDLKLAKRIGELEVRQAAHLEEKIRYVLNRLAQSEPRQIELGEALKRTNTELSKLLNFTKDVATVEFLDGLIAAAPTRQIPLDDRADSAMRVDAMVEIQNYINAVRMEFGDTMQAAILSERLAQTEYDAEQAVHGLVQAGGFGHINPIDLRKFAIAQEQREQVLTFLERQKIAARKRLSNERPELQKLLAERKGS